MLGFSTSRSLSTHEHLPTSPAVSNNPDPTALNCQIDIPLHLLTLPAEVRNKIWENVIDTELEYEITESDSFPSILDLKRYTIRTPWSGALRSNKQMSAEIKSCVLKKPATQKMVVNLGLRGVSYAHMPSSEVTSYSLANEYFKWSADLPETVWHQLCLVVLGIRDDHKLVRTEFLYWGCLRHAGSRQVLLDRRIHRETYANNLRIPDHTLKPIGPVDQDRDKHLFEALGLEFTPPKDGKQEEQENNSGG